METYDMRSTIYEREMITKAALAAGARPGSKSENCEQGQPGCDSAARDHREALQVVDISGKKDWILVVRGLISRGLEQKRPFFGPFLTLNHFDFSVLTKKVAKKIKWGKLKESQGLHGHKSAGREAWGAKRDWQEGAVW
jgi:hypothetical protein